MSTMYETNWHYVGDKFSHCTVTPIEVLREGILPGCTAVSIIARDASGREFLGSPDNYFKTEEDAWREIQKDLLETIEDKGKRIEALKDEIRHLFKYLCRIRRPEIEKWDY